MTCISNVSSNVRKVGDCRLLPVCLIIKYVLNNHEECNTFLLHGCIFKIAFVQFSCHVAIYFGNVRFFFPMSVMFCNKRYFYISWCPSIHPYVHYLILFVPKGYGSAGSRKCTLVVMARWRFMKLWCLLDHCSVKWFTAQSFIHWIRGWHLLAQWLLNSLAKVSQKNLAVHFAFCCENYLNKAEI